MQERFHAQRPPSTFVGIGAGFAILAVAVAGPLLLTPSDQLTFGPGLIFPAILVVFFAWVLGMAALKLFMTFCVTRDGILVRIPPLHRRLIRFDELEEVRHATDEETRGMIEGALREQAGYEGSSDAAGYLRMLRKRSPTYRYFTVAPRATVTNERITSLGVPSAGGMIALKLRGGEELYLTPQDPSGFKEAVDRARRDEGRWSIRRE